MNSQWQGKLDLIYAYNQGNTNLIHSFSQAPLKIQRSFYPEGKDICHSVILHTAGGIVGGDILSQNVALQTKAQVFITTPAATKVYRSEHKLAEYHNFIKLEDESFLEYLPLENIIFNGSNYQQNLQIDLSEKASFLGWEITRFGRTAREEKFTEGNWKSTTEIWRDGQPLWIDRQFIIGNEKFINHPHNLAGKPLVATLIYIGKPVTKEFIEQVRALGKNNINNNIADFGVTLTLADGLVCRYLGFSTAEVKQWFMEVWKLLRFFQAQRNFTKPRVWL